MLHTSKPYAITDGTSILNQFRTANGAAGEIEALRRGNNSHLFAKFYVARFNPEGWKSVWEKMAKQPKYNPHKSAD